jgi:hypothetical protein
VIQGTDVRRLHTFRDARDWNAGLPCSGRILVLQARGEIVRATFVLGDRGHSRCDGPGERTQALFRIQRGKIVLWHQIDPALEQDEESA